jgi:hypothetical protein
MEQILLFFTTISTALSWASCCCCCCCFHVLSFTPSHATKLHALRSYDNNRRSVSFSRDQADCRIESGSEFICTRKEVWNECRRVYGGILINLICQTKYFYIDISRVVLWFIACYPLSLSLSPPPLLSPYHLIWQTRSWFRELCFKFN